MSDDEDEEVPFFSDDLGRSSETHANTATLKSFPDRFSYGWNDFIQENIESIVSRVRFAGSYAADPDRLSQLEMVERLVDVRSVEEWLFEVNYPDYKLETDELTKYANPDVPVRAYMMLKCIGKLLELVEAPEVLKADFSLMMSLLAPKGANKYAKAQRLLIENPTWTITRISKEAGLDRSTIHNLLKKGVLLRHEY